MPAFLLELLPSVPPRHSEADSAPTASAVEEDLRQLLKPVGATSISIYWTNDAEREKLYLLFEASLLTAAGIENQIRSPQMGFTVTESHRVFTSHDLDAEHGLAVKQHHH